VCVIGAEERQDAFLPQLLVAIGNDLRQIDELNVLRSRDLRRPLPELTRAAFDATVLPDVSHRQRKENRHGAFRSCIADHLAQIPAVCVYDLMLLCDQVVDLLSLFADAVNGAPEFPEMLDEVGRARELDQFASSHDAQLGFVLRARHAAWSPGYVQQNAARLGFVAGIIPGRMVLPAGEVGLPPILGLSFDTQAALADDPAQSAIRELTLSLDVPQVDRSERPFERMREAAATLAREMDGVITDSDGQPLRDETMDAIGGDLEQLYDTLDSRDLSAGSPLARRLFS